MSYRGRVTEDRRLSGGASVLEDGDAPGLELDEIGLDDVAPGGWQDGARWPRLPIGANDGIRTASTPGRL